MPSDRRTFLAQAAAACAGSTLLATGLARADEPNSRLIIDTHQHLWNLDWQHLPWLTGAAEVLRRSYTPRDYAEATKGLNVKAVYMEVDVTPAEETAEAEHVIGLCRSKQQQTIAATIGGRPASPDFAAYLKPLAASEFVKGVRQVVHSDDLKPGYCLQSEFVRSVRLLGESGLHFDLCMRPTELSDGQKLTELCPDTRFVVDHCGNADPKAFGKQPSASKTAPSHMADQWKRDLERLATRPNVICKISGIVARAEAGWTADDLAPIVNHCLTVFGPDRVVFGGDWPVCLLGGTLRQWIDALQQIVGERPLVEQQKLWHRNAAAFYRLKL